MLPWLGAGYANPHAGHLAGRRAAKAVDAALQAIASLIGASPSDVIITSGATESNNLALQGLLSQNPIGSRLLHSAIEHKAVIEVGTYLRTRGVSVETISVDKHGRVEVDAARKIIETGYFDVVRRASEVSGRGVPPVGGAHLAAHGNTTPNSHSGPHT